MISDGIENCLQYMDNFNPDKSNNPFAYFTQIIYYAFIRRIQKEKKQIQIKSKLIANTGVENMMDQLQGDDAQYQSQLLDFLQRNLKKKNRLKNNMKIALLNDIHFRTHRNDSNIFDEYFYKFYDNIFFPYLKEHNIKTLIHLGDVVDRRKYINYRIIHNFRHKFMQRLWQDKIDTHILIGNHDIYYRNTNKVNAVQELCTAPDGINEPFIYEEPKVVNFDGLNILMMPG